MFQGLEQVHANHCRDSMRLLIVIYTVSAFQGRGKEVFRIMAQDQGFQEVFQGLGREWHLSNKLYHDLQRFICAMCMYCKNAGAMKSTSCDTGCSAWRKGMLISISYLPMTTHFASMYWELSTRLQFGNKVFDDSPKYLCLSDVAGALKVAGWQLIGWVVYRPRQLWNCCLANAAGPASFHHAPAWQMAWNVLRSVAFGIAITSATIMMSCLTMKMTMTTAIAGKAFVM